MLKYVRDSMVVSGLVRQLGCVRDQQLRAGVTGQVAPQSWLDAQERAARERTINHYFSPGARQLMGQASGPDPALDAADAEARTSRMSEEAAILTHRALAAIPWVGHPAFADPTPPQPAEGEAPQHPTDAPTP